MRCLSSPAAGPGTKGATPPGLPPQNGRFMNSVCNVACEVSVTTFMPLPEGASQRSFYAFLFRHRHDTSPTGDLAGDVIADPRAPKENTRLLDYLNRKGVDADVLEAA